jgi:hypothetical protein
MLAIESAVAQGSNQIRGELLPQLDALAHAAGNPDGRSKYISTLMSLVGGDALRKTFYSALYNRFMLDEERVGKGKQAPVSELSVSMAFNHLAETVKSPARVDVDTIHRLRVALSRQAPHLSTVGIRPSSCNPGESIFLVYLLAANNGSAGSAELQVPAGTPLPSMMVTVTTDGTQDIHFLISRFASGHSQLDVLKQVVGVLSLLNL